MKTVQCIHVDPAHVHVRTEEPDIGDIRIQKKQHLQESNVLSAKNIFIQHIPAKEDSSGGAVLREPIFL